MLLWRISCCGKASLGVKLRLDTIGDNDFALGVLLFREMTGDCSTTFGVLIRRADADDCGVSFGVTLRLAFEEALFKSGEPGIVAPTSSSS